VRTLHVPCPTCGTEMWVRYRIYCGRAPTRYSPAEPAELVPVAWECECGCETDQGEVQRAIERGAAA